MTDALLLVAHGSRDPRAAPVAEAVANAIAAPPSGPLAIAAFLELADPSVPTALDRLVSAGVTTVRIVPFLLTHAYHSKVDLPGVLEQARERGLEPMPGSVLGPDPLLVDALARRLAERPVSPDAIVLAAAGSSDPSALTDVRRTAADLAEQVGVPVRAAFASASGPGIDEAVRAARAAGAERVCVATYLLAPGFFSDRIRDLALDAGATAVTEPLGAAPEIVDLVLRRTPADLRVPA